MSGLAFSNDVADKLIATYSTPDLVRQREATLRRLHLNRGERYRYWLWTGISVREYGFGNRPDWLCGRD